MRWFELTPEAVLTAGLLVFLVDEPDAATSSFDSPKAIALMAVVTVAWLLGRLLAARLAPWRLARTGVFLIAALAILRVVVLPSYQNSTVVETAPEAIASATTTPAPTSTTTATTTATTAPSAVSPPAPTTTASTTTNPTTTAPAGPLLERTGTFQGIDHRAAGTVNLYRTAAGAWVVGLEDIDIQPGPDYDLYVVPGAGRDSLSGGTRLDDLRGNKGTQFYDVPAGLDLGDGAWTVLVWCHTFAVPVANATPS